VAATFIVLEWLIDSLSITTRFPGIIICGVFDLNQNDWLSQTFRLQMGGPRRNAIEQEVGMNCPTSIDFGPVNSERVAN
jgi:hypothetical protein